MNSRLGDAVGVLFSVMYVALIVFVPLGIWKLIEIFIWFFYHLDVSFI